MANRKSNRVRNYEMITYQSEEVIKAVLRIHKARIRHYAYILHDKDLKDDGEPAQAHYHVLMVFNNAMTSTAVQKLFPDNGQNTFPAVMNDKADCFNYLDHSDCPDKYQYSRESIVCDDLDYWTDLQRGDTDDDRVLNIIDDILDNVPFYELARRYGRDLVVNYQRYKEYADFCKFDPRSPSNRAKVQVSAESGSTPFDEQMSIDPNTGEVLG